MKESASKAKKGSRGRKDSKNKMKTKRSYVKKKKECDCMKEKQRKSSTKKKVKPKNARKPQKSNIKARISNKLPTHNEEMFDYQIQQLEMHLKQSLNRPTLTQEELKMLFMKYKLDGHYKTNKNLSTIARLLENSQDTSNDKNLSYQQMHYASYPDVQRINFRSNRDVSSNLNCNSNNKNQHTSLKYNSWNPKEVLRPNNVYVEQNSLMDSNYNNKPTNYDTQTCGGLNILDSMHNFGQSKFNVNLNQTTDVNEGQHSCNLLNMQNVFSSMEEYQTHRYINNTLRCNVADPSIQYENLTAYSTNSQENDIHCEMQYNDTQLNLNFHNDIHSSKWDNHISLIDNNNNFESCKNTQAVCLSHANNFESYCNLENNDLEEQNNFSLQNYTNHHPINENENLIYTFNSNDINEQQNYNTYSTNTTVLSDITNFFPETNTFVSS